MKFEPTAEQFDIIAAARDTSYNLCISARAGAAKTTTLCMIAEALNQEMLCIAFNKSIVEEMSKRMPKKCTVKTMHSLGYAAWRNYLGRKTRIKVFNGKIVKLLKDYIAEAPEDEKTFLSSEFFDTLDFINRAKINGYCPPEAPTNFVSLVAPEHLETILEFEIPQIQKDAVNWVLRKSAEEALQGNIDFTDMIYCPALCQVTFPRPKITLIDEAQDLSALDHRLLKKIVGKRRIIAVGDEKQAIYAFRGAHTDSMSRLQNTFSMVEMKLTTNFRCATTIIKSVNDFVPDIKARPDAPEGEVKTLPFWSTSDVPDNSAVICRNNAPLIDMAFRFLHDGVPVEINNFGLEKTLYAVVDKLGKPKTDTRIAKDALDAWESEKAKKARNENARQRVHDIAATLRIFLDKTGILGETKLLISSIFENRASIKFMTGHKSKGLEFDTVFFLDPKLCKVDRGQDKNLRYVIQTRAKNQLFFVRSDDFISASKKEAANA